MEVKYRTAVYSLPNIKKVMQNSTFYYEEVVDFDFSYYKKPLGPVEWVLDQLNGPGGGW